MLELKRVAKLYGVKVIFKDVSCAFAPGSVSLLVGGNGAGKSTLMRIMAGLSRPSAGTVRCAADDVRLGYLGHATFLYPGLTALENLAFWREAHGCAFPVRIWRPCWSVSAWRPMRMSGPGFFRAVWPSA